MLVYLIGFMGSGKTTVGEKLAKKLDLAFADLDELIVRKTKMSISQIFAEQGQDFFRECEQEVLRSTFKMKDTVVACGGGTPCFFENMQEMNKNGLTVYLRLTAGSLFHRLAPSKATRPLIAEMPDLPLMEYIVKELQQREPVYEQAGIVIKGESIKVDELAEMIRQHGVKQGSS